MSSEVFRNGAAQGCLGNRADDGVNFLAALEHHQRWNTANAVLAGDVGVLVGVEFEDLDLAVEFLCDFFDNRSNHATRTTPGSPEVDQHRYVALQHVLFEGGVGYSCGAGHMT